MTEKPKNNQGVSLVLIAVIAAITLAGLFAVILLSVEPKASTQTASSDFNGVTAVDPQDVPDFTMTNQNGVPTSLSMLRGKPTLIFFGFTHCPDVCPTTLGEFHEVHEEVGDQVNFVFISVDGVRDTPEAMQARFEKSRVPFVVGLTDSVEAVLKAGSPFGLVVEADPPDEAGNYNIAHTASVFVLDQDGRWVAKYAYGTPASVMIEDVRERL